MALLLTLVMWTLVAVVGLVILLLVTPVSIQLRLKKASTFSAQCKLRALGGLIPPITVFDSIRPRTSKTPKTKPKKRRKKPVGSKKFAKALPQFIVGILQRVHFDSLNIDCEFGLSDPADTGQLAGVVFAFIHGVPPGRRVAIAARPSFQGPCFEGDIAAVFHLTLASFVPLFLRFGWQVFGSNR